MSQRAAPVQHLTLHCKLTPADSCTQSGGCPAQAIAAPLGAALLKFLPARHLESMVSALMVLIMGLMNRQTLQQWATAGWHRLTQLTGVDVKASCTSASGCSSSSPLWEPSLTLPGSPLSRCVCVCGWGGEGEGAAKPSDLSVLRNRQARPSGWHAASTSLTAGRWGRGA